MAAGSSEREIGNILMSDVGTPIRRRNLKSPMILQERKYRTPNIRGGSVDQGSPSRQDDPVRALLRKLKTEKRLREKAHKERQLEQMKEYEARNEEQTRKFEELQKKLQEDKIQRIHEKHERFEQQRLQRLKF
mmetsp:Transcript_2078/g.2910  ORF Transcript_2078/g.2910 Transcript_2078/m.2910 type:complete len:133 (-) Transcript_2078:1600-1998(-)